MLDRQINLYKVDTSAFITPEENAAHQYLIKLKRVQKDIYKRRIGGRKGSIDKTIRAIKKYNRALNPWESLFLKMADIIKEEEKNWKSFLLKSAQDNVEYNNTHANKRIRNLDERYLSYIDSNDGQRKVNLSNVVAMFESTLSRSFGIDVNELTTDIFIVEIYYYDIAQDLILNGFDYNGKHYVYFSSSAGQIRTKKAVFVNEEKYNQCRNKLMCGLSVDLINEKGGMNVNKYLAYLALSNSATDTWEMVFDKEFDIDRCIVVDDFETLITCKVDDINYETYEITPGVEEDIPIPHTDGCGMILPECCSKNFMVRLPWIKGLLGSFDYKKFISVNNCSPVIKDIWGKEYDIINDNIQIIFTKSQLKMYKYYDSWDQYKEWFRKYNCEACVCNLEEDKISNAKINYQMLQTLYDATDKEIADICKYPNQKINDVCASLENALSFFGVDLDNQDEIHKDWFQKSLRIYPELLTDAASKQDLKDLKNSLVKKYKGAHLDVQGKFTFVLPDLYAFCEWLFCDIEKPLGLLENNEVYCRLYKNADELDCLRSPHLYIEHAIRNNVCNKKYRNQYLKEWFNTDAIYTSTHDPISRILQFDVDGDRLLVLAQKQIISIAKRCMVDVYPLYYEMHKAKAELLSNEALYNGLKLAFTGGRIGGISNNITKIWNSPEINDEAKSAIKWLCMETNFTIDYAKTLFKPTRPKEVNEIIKKYTKAKTPFFFQYAKNKEYSTNYNESQVEEINNSVINKIVKEIKNNQNMFRPIKNLNKINYKILLFNPNDNYTNDEINKCFNRWNRKYGNNVVFDDADLDKNNLQVVAKQVKSDLLRINSNEQEVLTSLIIYLYKNNSEKKKKLLWYIWGEDIYNNIKNNINQTPICKCCGCRTEEKLIRGKCFDCRQTEMKQKGYKLIKCVDCGIELKLEPKSRTCRCEECKSKERSRINANNYKSKIQTTSFE